MPRSSQQSLQMVSNALIAGLPQLPHVPLLGFSTHERALTIELLSVGSATMNVLKQRWMIQ